MLCREIPAKQYHLPLGGMILKFFACRAEFFCPIVVSRLDKTQIYSVHSEPLWLNKIKKMKKFKDINDLTGAVIGAAIEVHQVLGPGLLGSAYEECLCHELKLRGIQFERQVELPIEYKGTKLNCGYRMDVVADNQLILELKSCEGLHPIHEAQLLTYLKLTGKKVGLLFNFNVPILKQGIKRLAN